MTTRLKLGQCQVEKCIKPAKYGLFYTSPMGKKEWLNVCRKHEQIIGDANICRAGGRYEKITD